MQLFFDVFSEKIGVGVWWYQHSVDSQCFGSFDVAGAVVEKEAFGGVELLRIEQKTEYFGLWFQQMYFVREVAFVDELFYLVTFVGDLGAHAVREVYGVCVAEQQYAEALVQCAQHVQFFGRYVEQKSVERGVDVVVVNRFADDLSYAVVKFVGGDVAVFELCKDAGLRIVVDETVDVVQSELFESIDAALSVEVDEHTSEVENESCNHKKRSFADKITKNFWLIAKKVVFLQSICEEPLFVVSHRAYSSVG